MADQEAKNSDCDNDQIDLDGVGEDDQNHLDDVGEDDQDDLGDKRLWGRCVEAPRLHSV